MTQLGIRKRHESLQDKLYRQQEQRRAKEEKIEKEIAGLQRECRHLKKETSHGIIRCRDYGESYLERYGWGNC